MSVKVKFMGRTHLFECSKCGYQARVAGGAAEGEHFAVQTIACADCRALHDAVTRLKASFWSREKPSSAAPKFAVVLNRLPPRGARPWLKFKPACPVFPWHRVRLWKQPDKCPRCGNFLEANAVPFRLWD
jgi:ribosomal protein S27AE